MEDPPLTRLTPSMLHFWAYEHDQHARDEMIKLHPKRDQVVTVTIQDLNLDPPSSFSHSDHDDYLHQLRNTLYSRAIERQEFNFHLSEFRTTRFGGAKIQELNSSPSAASSGDSSGIVTLGGCGSGSGSNRGCGSGMAIGLNWRMPRAVTVRLPRDIAMAARSVKGHFYHSEVCPGLSTLHSFTRILFMCQICPLWTLP